MPPPDSSPSSRSLTRRDFLNTTSVSIAGGFLARNASGAETKPTRSIGLGSPSPVEEMLQSAVLRKEVVDRFLDPKERIWAKFHPQYGYLLRNTFMRDGVDGCHTLARYETNGYRHQVNFRDEPCRINTYGDSFTQGHQVSDGETWQEVLAAHFCEPIRNYGIGGFGVYQAAQRLLEIEGTDLGAPYLILNIWGDDHHRSINSWRWLTFPPEVMQSMSAEMFHANPWDHARLDPNSGNLIDIKNVCPTEESLYGLCDLDFVLEMFRNDEVIHAMAAMRTGIVTDPEPLERMAAAIGFKDLDLSKSDAVRTTVTQLHHSYAIQVGKKIVKRVQQFAKSAGKQLCVLLSHPAGSTWHHCAGSPADNQNFVDWHPQEFRDFLTAEDIPFINTVEKHVEECRQFTMDAKAYVDRYYIGHYNPQGNHFFAYAIKSELVDWLDPKPPAYQATEEMLIRFQGYLPS